MPQLKLPTEESILQALERGPLRPAAPSMWLAGTPSAPAEVRTRSLLDALVERGVVQKKPGGWYCLVDKPTRDP